MANAQLGTVLGHIRRMVASQSGLNLTDSQLLHEFSVNQDQTAFTALVKRHGPMVLGVCRHVLHHEQDAEDAFQATFLVLARNAASVRKKEALAGWLHGVAYRMAMSKKRAAARRRIHEGRAKTMPQRSPPSELALREMQKILHEEIQRLPERYLAPFVMCFLEGQSRTEAARQLGLNEGTVRSRLSRAREQLRGRLSRRGVALSALLGAAAILADASNGAVPSLVVNSTVKAALAYAAGNAAPGAISAEVAALVQGASKAMFYSKLKVATALLLAVSVGTTAFGVLRHQILAAEPTEQKQVQQPEPATTTPQSTLKDVFGDPLPRGALARLGTVRFRHGAPVHFLAFPPDGKTVISAANDRLVRVWDLATGKELHRIGPGGEVESLAFRIPAVYGERLALVIAAVSKDGKLLATHFDEPTVELWEVATGKKVGSIPLGKFEVMGLAFAPNGKHLAIASLYGIVRVWDIDAGKLVREFGKTPNVPYVLGGGGAIVYAPDGKTLVSLVGEGSGAKLDEEISNAKYWTSIKFWDPETGRELRTVTVAGFGGVVPPVFSPDGQLLAYAGGDCEIGLIKADTGVVLHKWRLAERLGGWPTLAFAADSTKLYSRLVGSGERIREWDVKTGKELRQLGDSPPVDDGPSLALTADGKMLSFGGSSIRFVDVASGEESGKELVSVSVNKDRATSILAWVRPSGGHSGKLLFVSYAPDGKSLLTRDGHSLRWWDLATGKQVKQLALPFDETMAGCNYTGDGRYLAVCKKAADIQLTDIASGKQVATIPRGSAVVSMVRAAPDGRTLVVCRLEASDAVLYEIPSGKELCAVPLGGQFLHNREVRFFFSPDGKYLGVYDMAKSVTIRDAVTGRALLKIPLGDGAKVTSGAFSPDGRTVALDQGDGLVRLVELASGKERANFGKEYTPKGMARRYPVSTIDSVDSGGVLGSHATVAFSPDGRLLAHAELDNSVQVWDTATGQRLARFEGHQGVISMIAFAPDGRSLASAGSDSTALVWDIQGLSAKAGPAPRVLDDDAMQARWKELAGGDAQTAGAAINAMVASRQQAVTFLKTRLQPVAAVEPAVIAKWIEQLDSSDFKVRQKAQADLLAAGEQVLPYLEKELARKGLPLQTRRRLEALQSKLAVALPATGDRLRLVRAVEALERIGNAEARQLLQTLAGGAPGTLAASQSEAALKRLKENP